MMCKKMKAYYYLPNLEADFCLNTHSNQFLFSELDETQLWCTPNRYAALLGLSNAVFVKVFSALALVSLTFISIML